MKSNPYPPYDDEPMRAAEPAVAYQRTDPATYRHGANPMHDEEGDAALDALMNADLSELGEGFRPFTWDDARRWVAEAEEGIAAGEVVPHEEVMRGIDELIRSYAN